MLVQVIFQLSYLIRKIENLRVEQEVYLALLTAVADSGEELYHRLDCAQIVVDEGDLALLAFLEGSKANSLEERRVRAQDEAVDLPRLIAALDGEVREFGGLHETICDISVMLSEVSTT